MKQFKILSLLLVAMLTFNCSSDDDSAAQEPTTQELLMSGKWYFSSISDTQFDICQGNGYYDFITTDTLIAQGFHGDASDQCESTGFEVATYVLINDNKRLLFTVDEHELIMSIEFISDSKLVLKQDNYTTSFVKRN